MNINPKYRRYILPGLLSVAALWGPWVWAYAAQGEPPLGDDILIGLAFWFSLPAGGPCLAVYPDSPEIIQNILESVDPIFGNPIFYLLWIFLSVCVLAAMTVIGAQGKWRLVAVVTIGLAFEILSTTSAW